MELTTVGNISFLGLYNRKRMKCSAEICFHKKRDLSASGLRVA